MVKFLPDFLEKIKPNAWVRNIEFSLVPVTRI
jgi:hypothetical protein